LFEFPYVLAA